MDRVFNLLYLEPRPGIASFFLALFSGQLSKLPRSPVNGCCGSAKLLGWILVGMAAYFIRPLLPKTAKIFLNWQPWL